MMSTYSVVVFCDEFCPVDVDDEGQVPDVEPSSTAIEEMD